MEPNNMKPDKWQLDTSIDREPTAPPPEGFKPAGPWEPFGVGVSWDRRDGQVCHDSFVYWRRPLVVAPATP